MRVSSQANSDELLPGSRPQQEFHRHPVEGRLAFLSMGSNIEPEKHLPLAQDRLPELGTPIRISNVYQNPATGPMEQEDFLNAAALIETVLTAFEIRDRLREIEEHLGRIRVERVAGYSGEAAKYAPRTIDLDLSMLGGLILNTPGLILPDPELLTHSHLAVTMAEVAPDFIHPVTGEPLKVIAERLRPMANLKIRPDVWERGEFGGQAWNMRR